MSREQTEKRSGSSQDRRRSRPRSMSPQLELTELAKFSELGSSTSRKHDRRGDDYRAEGPSKRAKMHSNSEPPSRKDATTTPEDKREKTRKKINKRKASRTRNHHELQEINKTLVRQLWDAEQALKDTKQELEDTKQELEDTKQNIEDTKHELEYTEQDRQSKIAELKRVQMICAELQSLKALADDPVNGIEALKESCREKDEKLEEKDLNIAAKQDEIDACRKLNDTNGEWNARIQHREDTAKEKLKTERKEHKKAFSTLKAENSDLEQQCTDLKATLVAQVNESNEMIIKLQKELQDSHPQSQRFNFKLPDEIVKQGFNYLESNIRQFVDKHVRIVLNTTDEELQNIWPNWSPQLRQFLTSPLLSSLALEGYVWECLLKRVFAPWSEVWPGEVGQLLEKALSIAGEKIEHAGFGSDLYADYQHWRSRSSSFIRRLIGENLPPESFDSAVEIMITNMAKLCGGDVTHDMKADAMSIFEGARDFELQLRMLKAEYRFRMCKSITGIGELKYGMFFDNEAMIDRSPSPIGKSNAEVPKVDFIMSPGLHKRGSNDGERYENDTWLIKMDVVCNAARFVSKSGSFMTPRLMHVQTQQPFHPDQVQQEDECEDRTLQYDTGSTANGNKAETPIEIKDADSCDELDLLSVPSLTHDSPAARSHVSTQMQSGTASHMVTRSQASTKTHTSVDDGKLSNKPGNNHL